MRTEIDRIYMNKIKCLLCQYICHLNSSKSANLQIAMCYISILQLLAVFQNIQMEGIHSQLWNSSKEKNCLVLSKNVGHGCYMYQRNFSMLKNYESYKSHKLTACSSYED